MSSTKNLQLAQHIAQVESQARAANNLLELGFSIANDSYGLLGFRQALVYQGADEKATLLTVSGLAKPTEGSPYLVWLGRAWKWLFSLLEDKPQWIQSDQVLDRMPEDIRDGWQEWWPLGLYVVPVKNRQGVTLGWVVFLLEQPVEAWQQQSLDRLTQTWGYCWEMLVGKPKRGLRKRWQAAGWSLRAAIIIGLLLVLMLPVRQTVLAPAEVVSLESQVIAAPIDGVVKAVQVRPNQLVQSGELLFSLDETTLRNRLEVVRQSVAVADAEYIAATQKAFHDSTSQSELAVLSGRAHERRAELAAVQLQLSRTQVSAANDGVAVFADPDDWLGRPVSTGERIMLLANPNKPGILIHLPVADALVLEPGAKVKLFLTTKPLNPLEAELIETGYQAMLSPDGISSYRLRARFVDLDEQELVRIGLQGTAKLYGDRVMLGYYIMRRPLAALREWTGW